MKTSRCLTVLLLAASLLTSGALAQDQSKKKQPKKKPAPACGGNFLKSLRIELLRS